MVTRNELGRYLEDSLHWLEVVTGGHVAVYDDQSDDGTYEYLRDRGVPVECRPDTVPSFLENESAFRAAAWAFMERTFQPVEREWILCLDADEFLVANDPHGSVRPELQDLIHVAEGMGQQSVTLRVHECFGFDEDGTPLLRTDGFWGGITACRLVRWRPDGTFESRVEGGGSVPWTWTEPTILDHRLSLMHLGYLREADRDEKWRRYASGRGHNPLHVDSILRPGRLERWSGMAVPFELRAG